MVICDCCKQRPVLDKKYVLPRYTNWSRMLDGIEITTYTKLSTLTADLCKSCAERLAEAFDVIQQEQGSSNEHRVSR